MALGEIKMENKCDFSGWATKANVLCSDGRVIQQDAFKDQDGCKVPIVWGHTHDDPSMVLGYGILKNYPEGVRVNGYLNNSQKANDAREGLRHGDFQSLSIYANKLVQEGNVVVHGLIREVSLVLAGANPEAYIDSIMQHSFVDDDESIICTDEPIELSHDEDVKETKNPEIKTEIKEEEAVEMAEPEAKEKTVKEVFDTLNEEQKNVVYALIGAALEDNEPDDEEDEDENEEGAGMKHNAFDQETQPNEDVLAHSDMEMIIKGAKREGSMRASAEAAGFDEIYLRHDDPKYGVENPYGIMGLAGNANSYGVEALFPDARNYTNTPQWISRNMEWVAKFMNAASHSPFSRVKTMFADITEDEARARGYIKGNQKKEEVFSLLKRVTEPTTVYKKQKMDRDDIVDITDFDVVAWIKSEMRVMLNEEIARAALIGDGRTAGTDDKIDETHIRPIWTDADFYSIKTLVDYDADPNDMAKNIIRAAVKARKNYKGSGNPTLWTTEDTLTDMLLLEDSMGRVIYDTKEKLCAALRVSSIETVELMENKTRTVSGDTRTLLGIIVNPRDYNFGADKGGAVALFDDFDIDYNQQKYLIETRLSGALVKPYSAIVLETVVSNG
jgi:Phage capsid family./Caudovirus prohead protease.